MLLLSILFACSHSSTEDTLPKETPRVVNTEVVLPPPEPEDKEGDEAQTENPKDLRDKRASMWFWALKSLEDETLLPNLETSVSSIPIDPYASDKSQCFWKAYAAHLHQSTEEVEQILNQCQFSRLSFDYLILNHESLYGFTQLAAIHFDIESELNLLRSHPDIRDCSNLPSEILEFPISAATNAREWQCQPFENHIQIHPKLHPYNQRDMAEYETTYKSHHMLLDGYEDQNRIQATGVPLWELSKLGKGMRIGDVGSGPGLFSFEMSKIVGDTGRVVAVDINESVLDFINYKADRLSISNIQTHLTKPEAINLDGEELDIVFVTQTYHAMIDFNDPDEQSNYTQVLRPFIESIERALKDDGALIIQDHSPSVSILEKQLGQAGFVASERYVELFRVPNQENVRWKGTPYNWVEYDAELDLPFQTNYLVLFKKE
jgi:ubiquinone/menaquinone biosynthesis C-methylase UbiE